ncbi:MAG: hypothetical protein K2X02_08480 [Alphaproteobacteria bacterium]|nr:hypothetical protein [Alphaproteobacteria bacterium]
MNQVIGTSKEAQNKLLHFLKEEFARLKSDCQEEFKKKGMIKRKNIDKKRQKLHQKIEAVFKIQSLDAEIKEGLLSLQEEIKNFI